MFSKSCEYGLQGVLYIALHDKDENKNSGLRDISDSQDIPYHFLSKILQQLVKAKILGSIKGPNGGFFMRRDPGELKLIEIVEVIDGLDRLDRCGIGMKKCGDDNPCPIHKEYKSIREKITDLFSNQSVADLVEDVKAGHSFVKFAAK